MPTEKITVSTVPFAKNNEFDYSGILFWMNDEDAHEWAWIVFIPIVIFIVTAVSNGAILLMELMVSLREQVRLFYLRWRFLPTFPGISFLQIISTSCSSQTWEKPRFLSLQWWVL